MTLTSKIIQYGLQKSMHYLQLVRFDKPIGTLLLLWPTLWALWLAGKGHPDPAIVVIFIVGTVCMRSAGCILNDIADRQFDGSVERTRERPLVTGNISLLEAKGFLMVLLGCAGALVLLLNRLTILLSIVGLVLAMVYPYLKRATHLPQLGLGLAFSWGVPMAFAAIDHQVSWKAWMLFITAAIWPVIYDTLYAVVDQIDDEKIGIKSTAQLFGKRLHAIVSGLQMIFVLLLIEMGHLFNLNLFYNISLGVVLLLFLYQQRLMRRDHYFKAFLNNQWVGCAIFMGIVLSFSI